MSAPIEVLITMLFPPDAIQRLKALSPRLQITELIARRTEDISKEAWARTEVLYTDTVIPEPDEVPSLKWIQLHYAGVDYALDAPIIHNPDIVVTTLSGVAAPQIAEYVLMMLLSLGHHMPEIIANREKADWPRDRSERYSPRELRGSTVGIVGYGSLGREVARLLQTFGVKVLAAKRDVFHPQDEGYTIPGLGDPEGNCFQRLYPIEAVGSMVKECDFVVICLPLTSETRGLISAEVLRQMKPSAYLVGVGRGATIDQVALLSALQEKRLAGAALDAFTEEPLPSNSPFWRLPNTLISPHIAGLSPLYRERAINLLIANMERYINGVSLFNRFDPKKEY
jgi:phosphoglycerate dehydrogenase-like enzyme